jgi:hypothetical protein
MGLWFNDLQVYDDCMAATHRTEARRAAKLLALSAMANDWQVFAVVEERPLVLRHLLAAGAKTA